jgi:hypothetical protein
LHNSSIRHSGLDPESREYLIILDSRFRGNDGSGMDSGACPGLRSGIHRNDKIAGYSYAKFLSYMEIGIIFLSESHERQSP